MILNLTANEAAYYYDILGRFNFERLLEMLHPNVDDLWRVYELSAGSAELRLLPKKFANYVSLGEYQNECQSIDFFYRTEMDVLLAAGYE